MQQMRFFFLSFKKCGSSFYHATRYVDLHNVMRQKWLFFLSCSKCGSSFCHAPNGFALLSVMHQGNVDLFPVMLTGMWHISVSSIKVQGDLSVKGMWFFFLSSIEWIRLLSVMQQKDVALLSVMNKEI
jgi:hypothetical protein